jgi:hypothetical protein
MKLAACFLLVSADVWSAAPAATAKTGKSQVVNVADTDALIKKMRARGFQRERCNTLDELKDAERTGQDFTNQIQQQGSPTPFKGDMPPSSHP